MPDQAQPLTAEAVLAREAVYRAIGEGFFRPAVAAQVNFPAWYTSELADLLQVRARPSPSNPLRQGRLAMLSYVLLM